MKLDVVVDGGGRSAVVAGGDADGVRGPDDAGAGGSPRSVGVGLLLLLLLLLMLLLVHSEVGLISRWHDVAERIGVVFELLEGGALRGFLFSRTDRLENSVAAICVSETFNTKYISRLFQFRALRSGG